ncbi:MAG: hypothetical protein GVY36_11405 [Verrucomicrobia bacterium]|jgi:HEAT repeat protein|nr:hypothetical protein [Verrucomicrobiota bacterium]
MKNLFYLLCFLTAQIAAANIQAHLSDLDATDYKDQQAARNSILEKLAAASAPEAPKGDYGTLLADIHAAVQSSSSTNSAKAYLIEMLGLFGDSTSAQILYPLLGDSNEIIRERARKALAALPDTDAAGFLMNGLLRGPQETRARFMQALVYNGHEPAWESMIKLLASTDRETQKVAAWSLGQLGVAEAVEPLWSARDQVYASNLVMVETAILQIGPDTKKSEALARSGTSASVRVNAFKHLANQDPVAAIALLEAVLADADDPARPGFIHAAISHENTRIQSALVDASERLTSDEKIIMVGAISDQGLTEYEGLLVEYLQSDDATLARSSVDALGWIGGDQSFEAMAAYTTANLGDEVAIRAMGRLNAPAADDYYLSILENPSDLTNALAAIEMVQIRNSPNGVERLNALALDSSKPELQEAAFGGLETIGNEQSIKNLLTVIFRQGPLTRTAQRSLKRLSLNYGAPEMQWERAYLPALESAETADQKIAIIQILDGVASKPSLDYLANHAFDPELQSAIMRSLRRWPKYDVASVWVKLSADARADEALMSTAAAALRRSFNSDSMDGEIDEKAQAAAEALALSSHKRLKESIASGFHPDTIKRWKINRVQRTLQDFKDDPDVGELLAPLFEK